MHLRCDVSRGCVRFLGLHTGSTNQYFTLSVQCGLEMKSDYPPSIEDVF